MVGSAIAFIEPIRPYATPTAVSTPTPTVTPTPLPTPTPKPTAIGQTKS